MWVESILVDVRYYRCSPGLLPVPVVDEPHLLPTPGLMYFFPPVPYLWTREFDKFLHSYISSAYCDNFESHLHLSTFNFMIVSNAVLDSQWRE